MPCLIYWSKPRTAPVRVTESAEEVRAMLAAGRADVTRQRDKASLKLAPAEVREVEAVREGRFGIEIKGSRRRQARPQVLDGFSGQQAYMPSSDQRPSDREPAHVPHARGPRLPQSR